MEQWRLLIDPPGPAAYNMAVDEAIAYSCRTNAGPPTLRLYAWDRPSISLGYFQRPEGVVDIEACRAGGVPVVTRTTGGRAVYHDDELTYSLTAPIPHPLFPPTIRGTFAVAARALAAGMTELGVAVAVAAGDAPARRAGQRSPLCFESAARDEITLDGKKLIGSAQRRWKTAFLQHGSILLQYDHDRAARCFLAPFARPERITGLTADGRCFTMDQVRQALVKGWEQSLGVVLVPGALTESEARRVAESPHARDRALTVAQECVARSVRSRTSPARR